MRIVFQYLLIICSSYSKVVVGQIIFPGGSSGSTFVSGNNNNNKPRPVYQQQGTSSNPYGSFPPKKPPGAGLGSSFAPQKFPQQNGKPDGLPPTSDGCTDFTGSSGVCVPNVLCVEFFEQIAARTSISRESCNLADGTIGVCCPVGSAAAAYFTGSSGVCVPNVLCVEFFEQIAARTSISRESCNLADGTIGVCCPVGSAAAALRPPPRPTEGKVFDVNPSLQGIETRQFSRSDINTAVTSTRDSLQTILEIEKRLKENGDYLPKGTPAFYHQQFFQVSPESHELARLALGGIEATRQIANSFGLGPLEAGFGLQRFTLEGTDLSDFCPPPPKCDRKSLTYRTTDGSCNNLDKPSWGKSNTPMQRLLPPTYHDGIWEPRKLSASGQPLKSARLVSASTIFDADKPDHFFTQFVTQFGQFLDHDITHAGVFKLDPAENTGIMCCRNGQPIVPAPHPSCMPIEIPNQDRFYARYRQKCMEFVRAIPAPRPGCTLGWAEQMNVNSHYLDGSAVYGSHEEEARNLRLFRNGQLQVLNTGSHHLPMLPLADNEGDDCTNKTAGIRCFKAGDDRVNEQIGLTLIHLVWVREHNRVAGELQALNPHWDDERLFQESRRIVVAELQHIVYNEWLPLILGPRYMFNFRLFPQREGFSREYDPSIDPSVTNEFATAAFRFGHTLLQRTYQNGQPIIPAPHPSCMPIEIPNEDRFYARYRQKCMEFVRAIPAPRPGCTLGWAEQMNVNSHYLDGSAVYGSHEEEARNLRLFRNGQLQVLNTGSHHLPMLPLADNEGDDCTNKTAGIRCFKAGDDRVNEQIGLTLIHLVWVREHNRVAGELQALNPHWDDERLFQESRRIVVAELQHIVYNEWLPLILGPRYMFNFRLFPQREGFSREYDPSIDPSVTNEFATAAFRFGHTLLQRTYQ
ncbi:unnamed protein product [Notodromas monacha]|uniref:Chorion peroxidase n=1 Tax=Notodromas monacha TaxID=399045 RepID=A0A7R9BV73_9CRUS|nr:unnamed protein product [Notodromas monacha]CAG0922361.1 unnamed protein product [Notodromas monacha]